jgi:hypothetical protein
MYLALQKSWTPQAIDKLALGEAGVPSAHNASTLWCFSQTDPRQV